MIAPKVPIALAWWEATEGLIDEAIPDIQS